MSVKILANREDIHIYRKLWHVFMGIAAIGFYYVNSFSTTELRWVALFIAIAGFAVDGLRLKNEKLNNLVLRFFSPIMRKSEQNSFSGLPFYALGVTLSLFFYEADIAILSILFLVFADPIAALIGVIYGKEKIIGCKTFEGTAAAFIVCAVVSYIFTFDFNTSLTDALVFSIACGVIGSISELFSAFNIDDNLTIPVLSGAGISLLNLWIPIF